MVLPSACAEGCGLRLGRRCVIRQGYCALRLDVIDTNPVARRLYERVGFQPVRTERFPYMKWLLGFAAATQMQFDLKPGARP